MIKAWNPQFIAGYRWLECVKLLQLPQVTPSSDWNYRLLMVTANSRKIWLHGMTKFWIEKFGTLKKRLELNLACLFIWSIPGKKNSDTSVIPSSMHSIGRISGTLQKKVDNCPIALFRGLKCGLHVTPPCYCWYIYRWLDHNPTLSL